MKTFMKYFFILFVCAPIFLSADDNGDDINQSSMVGVINWSSSSAETTMKAFINEVEAGFIQYTTLPSKSQQNKATKNAVKYHLYMYNPEAYSQYDNDTNRKDYETVRLYEKYKSMNQLALQCANSIEEDLQYAYKYDADSLLGATGVKIAEIAQQIFSEPYSRIINKVNMDYSDNMIKSSADLAIAQQAAFYSRKISSMKFKDIYIKILKGFNSAQITFVERKTKPQA